MHLRFGAVARGGLRWSDRRDDFRTEVLGLVKAQMVKNTVIVPVGAKGGFFCKQLPDPRDRDAWMAEGIACYKTFISGLLDITDNLVEGDGRRWCRRAAWCATTPTTPTSWSRPTRAPPPSATSPTQVSADYGFWLGDAFASGGSVGYDHKAMGITARGAWVSVRRHFREMGVDCQNEDFTCVGVGDMSGDVFGNGMLCSEHTRLVAAFDHRDIFVDPDPDAAASYAERKRLFDLPRSSWQDYDTSLISEGGGVFPRSAKSIPVSPQMREALGLEGDRRPADDAGRADARDPAGPGGPALERRHRHLRQGRRRDPRRGRRQGQRRDPGQRRRAAGQVRRRGRQPRPDPAGPDRVRPSGRGGTGGRINTDFIDNSAGVDTSDHEVNIKILLDRVVADGDLTGKQRNELLASMTDEVAELVLADNYDQNLALANAESLAPALLHVHEDWMRTLERARPAQPRAGGAADAARGGRAARAQARGSARRSSRC